MKELCEKCGCPVHPCLPCEEVVALRGNTVDMEYCGLLKDILANGKRKKNRTGMDTIGVFGRMAKFDVRMDAFPILTTKKVWFKGIVHELLWFIKGDTNIKYLVDNDVHIWDDWAYKRYKNTNINTLAKWECKGSSEQGEELHFTQDEFVNWIKREPSFAEKWGGEPSFAEKWGELGEGTYGGMWRAFPYSTINPKSTGMSLDDEIGEVDQLAKVMDKLKTNPDDRRMIVSAWHPYWVDHCALPPCHCLFHFNTEELTLQERWTYAISSGKHCGVTWENEQYLAEHLDTMNIPTRRLNLLLYQRSCDTFLGVPFNITSYSLLLAMVAHCVGMEPGTFTHTYGDLHIYENHIDQVNLQLSRTPKVLPRLILAPKKYGSGDLFSFEYKDIILTDYDPHPTIKAPIAV